MAGKRAGRVSWDPLRPRRTSGWEERDGRIALLIPRFGRGRLGRTLDRWFRLRPYLLRLDEIGSFVWTRIDGERTVSDIAAEMEAGLGDAARPVMERLVTFLRTLERGGYIAIGAERGEATGDGSGT
jgi:hypothetical protein